MEFLEDIHKYIKYLPDFNKLNNRGITRKRYYHYHVNNFFAECFVLRERFVAFINVLLKRVEQSRKGRRKLINYKKYILNLFQKISTTRNTNIHNSRIEILELNRIDAFELIYKKSSLTIDQMNFIKIVMIDKLTKESKDYWTSITKELLLELKEIYNEFYSTIYENVFYKTGNLRKKKSKKG